MEDASLHERLGYIEGKLDTLLDGLTKHMATEERIFATQDARLRTVEKKVHTTWIIGGGAILTTGVFIKHLLKW